MGLITLLNNPSNFRFYTGKGYSGNGNESSQKNLKYGNDRLGGANSGQPYITTDIPEDLSPYIGTQDYLNRGGINVIRDSNIDVLRLSKMFNSDKSPNGIFFVTKQQLLSRTAPRTQTSGILNEGIYSPLNTLAQASVVAFGGHLNKQGINPFADTGAFANNMNLYDVKANPFRNPDLEGVLGIGENRLVRIWNTAVEFSSVKVNNTTYNKGNNFLNILSYTGGPDSYLGVGSTNIRSQSEKNRTPLTVNSSVSNFSTDKVNSWVYSSQTISTPYVTDNEGDLADGLSVVSRGTVGSPNIQDFRVALRSSIKDQITKDKVAALGLAPKAPNYYDKNYDERTNLGQPGQRSGKSYADYSKGVEGTTPTGISNGQSIYGKITTEDNLGTFQPGLDKINSVPIYRSENVSTDPNLKDLVDFRIAAIDNNDPSFKTFMHFRAFLGTMGDNYISEWNAFRYLGRGENFYTYGGYTRTISLSWTIAAQSKQELLPMYKKLNYLSSLMTPDYSSQGYMRGNLVQLTVGGYLNEQVGIITNLSYDISEESPWEIAIGVDGNVDPTAAQLPHIIKVNSFTFIPIQNFIPRKQDLTFSNNINTTASNTNRGFVNTYGNQNFISLINPSGSSLYN